ncbi:hypothetical protein BGZ63DRAFT_421725 [Mariannaea sp. PMI_226]|nr:hypothetical protein BGZ63DRAFT_421725 [Mariannaea sp. PMI_226]
MSISSMAHIFESGINAIPNKTGSLEALVKHQIETFARERENAAKSTPLATPATPGSPVVTSTPAPISVIPETANTGTATAGPVSTTLALATAAPAPRSPKLAPIAPIAPLRPSLTRSNTITTETGDYLVEVARTLGRLTANLVSGVHVERAVFEMHEHSRLVDRLSDLTTVVAMDVEQQRLRKIQQLTEKFYRDVEEAWQVHAAPDSPELAVQQSSCSLPFERPSLPQAPVVVGPTPSLEVENILTVKSHVDQGPLPASQASPAQTPAQTSLSDDVAMSDGSDDEEEEIFSTIDMDALKQRGKGSYYCPLGHRCDRGGVDKSGNLVLFDRNSSFAYTTLQ